MRTKSDWRYFLAAAAACGCVMNMGAAEVWDKHGAGLAVPKKGREPKWYAGSINDYTSSVEGEAFEGKRFGENGGKRICGLNRPAGAGTGKV